MNSGAFGENFPYTNFHDLNMDWILKTVKDFEDHYTTIETSIDTGVETLENKTNEGVTELEDKTTEGVDAVNTTYEDAVARLIHVVSNMTRRIILIGDSYFNRVNPNNKKIPEIVQPIINYSDDNYYYTNIAGGAFSHIEPDHRFLYLLQQLYPSISNPDTITDVYVCCGANDAVYEYQANRDNVRTFAEWCKNNLPKALVKIVPWGVTFTGTDAYYKNNRAMQAFRSCAEFGVITIENAKYLLCNSNLMEADRCHPNSQYGVNNLAWALAGIIQTDTCQTHYDYTIEQLTPTVTVDNLVDPVILQRYMLENGRMARDNENVIVTQVNNYPFATLIFNVNHPTIGITNYIHISLDNSIACGRIISTGSDNSPSFMAEIVDSADTTRRIPAIACIKYNSPTDKYEILIRPQSSFTLSQNNNIVWVYLSFGYTD